MDLLVLTDDWALSLIINCWRMWFHKFDGVSCPLCRFGRWGSLWRVSSPWLVWLIYPDIGWWIVVHLSLPVTSKQRPELGLPEVPGPEPGVFSSWRGKQRRSPVLVLQPCDRDSVFLPNSLCPESWPKEVCALTSWTSSAPPPKREK